jgi:hypothetical protein
MQNGHDLDAILRYDQAMERLRILLDILDEVDSK